MLGRRASWVRAPLGTAALVLLAACGGGREEPTGTAWQPLAHPGPWVIPEDVLAAGDSQYVEYTGAGPWIGPSGCSGALTPGAEILREYLYETFPQTPQIGGYSCRVIEGTDQMSVHGTGRALDVMIPTDDGDADNDLGDPVGHFLIENAEAIGIQYIIWDQWTWRADREPGAKDRAYGGVDPHLDHLHIELSVAASEHTEMWFADDVTPPGIEGCGPIPPEGAIVDDASACFRVFGPAEYWRVEQGVGYDGGLHWTNAFEGDEPSNWARWQLSFVQAGSYELEVFLDPAFAVAHAVRYEVTANGQPYVDYVDQSATSGWRSLGSFDFGEGAGQGLDLLDDQPDAVPDDQHIVADAIRLTGPGQAPPADPGNPLDPSQPGGSDPGDPDSSAGIPGADAGCSCRQPATPRDGRLAAMLAAGAWVVLAAARRRRR